MRDMMVDSGQMEVEEILESPRNFNGGFFDRINSLIEESSIVELEQIQINKDVKDGYVDRYGFTTENGYSYSAFVGRPKVQSSDIPIIYTTAWWTSTEGHNERTARNLMRLGNVVIMIGAEGSWHKGLGKVPDSTITLDGSASAMLEFSRAIAGDYQEDIDLNARILIGESRGAMVGMGALALDKVFDQDIKFADLTAPCFPRKVKVSDSLLLASQIYHEPLSTIKLLGRLTFSRLMHYPSTVDINPSSLMHQLAITPALLGGDAGEMAKLIDRDKIVHITCFKNDKASMQREWSDIFIDNPNAHIVPLEGSHLSLADPETISYVLGRNIAFNEAYSRLGDDTSLEHIIAPAHIEAVKAMDKIG